MKALKRISVNFILICFAFVFGLFLVGLGVRLFGLYRFPAHNFVQQHPELGWSHIPNKEGWWEVEGQRINVRINAKGLRDREYAYEKGEGTFRILVLGDSFIEALQVNMEDTFCKVLEKELNKIQRNFEVVNAGFAGVGTDYELLFFRREGYRYRPDLVILAFFGNDIYDNYRSKDLLDNKTASLAYERRGLVEYVRGFLAQKSCAYNYLGYLLPKHVPSVSKLLMELGLLSSQPIDDAEGIDLLQHMVFAKEYGPKWEEAWDVTRLLISELEKETKAHGSDLAVFCIPYIDQVYETVWKSKLSKIELTGREWVLNKPELLMAGFLESADIHFLELLPHFRKAAESAQLYYPRDGHWNVHGHHLAGKVVYDWLVKEKLVPIEAVKAPR